MVKKLLKSLVVLISILGIGIYTTINSKADDGVIDLETCIHEFGDWVIEQESTCISKGVRYHTCSICYHSEQEVMEYSSHQYSQTITKLQTSTEHGEFTYTCSVCGDVYTTIAHNPGDWSDPGVSCTEVLISIKRCTVCNAQLDTKEIEPIGHQYTDWQIINEATCTEEGSKQRSCTICHTEVEIVVIDAEGHNLVNHSEVSPTCHTFGHVAYEECTKCDYTTYYVIPPEDHFMGENIFYKSTTSYLTLQDIKLILINDLIICDCKLRYEVEDINYVGKGNVSGTYFVNFKIYNDSLENTDYPDYVETYLINIIVSDKLKSDYVYKNNLYFRSKINAEAIVSDMKLLQKIPNVNLATEFKAKEETDKEWSAVVKTGTYIYDINYVASSGESGSVGVKLNLLAPLITTTDDTTTNSKIKTIIINILIVIIVVGIISVLLSILGTLTRKKYRRKKR